jgi:hypothetical protein
MRAKMSQELRQVSNTPLLQSLPHKNAGAPMRPLSLNPYTRSVPARNGPRSQLWSATPKSVRGNAKSQRPLTIKLRGSAGPKQVTRGFRLADLFVLLNSLLVFIFHFSTQSGSDS